LPRRRWPHNPKEMSQRPGVLAVQGDFEAHAQALREAGAAEVRLVRTPDDLSQVDRLIIPGGESTTVGLLMTRYGLDEALKARAQQGMPIWGTCMGMILLSRAVEGREQATLGLLDIVVRRNAFGAQVHSFEQEMDFEGLDEPVTAVFIRAPEAVDLGPGVQVRAQVDGRIVAVEQDRILGTSFHPELTADRRLHRRLLEQPGG
jgi:5'-phosphate synthase pdxT subunit